MAPRLPRRTPIGQIGWRGPSSSKLRDGKMDGYTTTAWPPNAHITVAWRSLGRCSWMLSTLAGMHHSYSLALGFGMALVVQLPSTRPTHRPVQTCVLMLRIIIYESKNEKRGPQR